MKLFSIITGIFILYVLISEVRYSKNFRKESKFLEGFDLFLGRVRHYYYFKGSVNDAIYSAIDGCEGDIRNRMRKLLATLEKEDIRLEGKSFGNELHRFEKTLLSLALVVNENGDSTDENGSVFVRALMQLRNDVQDQNRYMSQRRHRFTGLGLTAALPVAAIPFVADWATDTLPSLIWFYYGHIGGIVRCILLCIAFAVYSAISWLRTGDSPGEGSRIFRRDSRTVRVCSMCVAIVIAVPILIAGHADNRRLLLDDVSEVESLCDTADPGQIHAMERLIPEYVRELTASSNKNEDISTDSMIEKLLEEKGIRTSAVAAATAEEISARVARYRKEHFNIFDLLLLIPLAIGAYFTPLGVAAFRRAFTVNRQQDEVLMIQSLIHMQKDVPGMNPILLLESMERQTVCFKSSITRCLNEFNTNDIAALQNMARTETNPGFRRIVDCFLSVDEAGMKDAFAEISDEIVNFQENRKLERMILLDNDALLASVLAVIPGSLILFGYLLIPFMVKSLAMFDIYQDSLSDYIQL